MKNKISRIRESDPPPRLGKPMYYRCTNPASFIMINKGNEIIKIFLIMTDADRVRINFVYFEWILVK